MDINYYNDLVYYINKLNQEINIKNNLNDISDMINICINILQLLDQLLEGYNENH